jgi:large subunit ribosomal protein L6
MSMSRWKKAVPVPSGVTATVAGQTLKMKGPKGELSFDLTDDVELKIEGVGRSRSPREYARTNAPFAHHVGHDAQPDRLDGRTACPKGYVKAIEINGTGYRAAVQGKRPVSWRSATAMTIRYPIPSGIKITCRSRPPSS